MKKLIMFLVVCIAFVGTANAALRVHYTFDGNALDHSYYGNDGTLLDNPTYVAGVFGQGIDFDGVMDGGTYLDSVKVSAPITGLTNWSVVYWMAMDATPDGLDPWYNSDGYYTYAGTYGGQLYTKVNGTGGTWQALPADSAYYHYAYTMDSNDVVSGTVDVKAYVDGVLVATGHEANALPGGAGSINLDAFYLGSRSGNYAGTGVDGRFDDFAIFDTALTQAEIDGIVANGVAAGSWGSPCLNPSSLDTDGNCKIDYTDLAVLLSQWLDCGYEDQGDCL